MPHIAIIVDSGQPFETLGYCLSGPVDSWRAHGLEVEVYDSPASAKDADLAILHVDQTIVPVSYRSLAARYPKCLNRYTSDISKRAISRQLVSKNDGFEGPVIVKSNLNSGGAPEAARSARLGAAGGTAMTFKDYCVLQSPREVPDAIWSDPLFVVERFLPEREGARYCVRLWNFLGSHEIVYRCESDEPIVKASNTVRRTIVEGVPEELRQWREEMGFDFGKFDFGIVEGRPVLYDANRTPTYSRKQSAAERVERDGGIANGIWEYLPAGLRR